MSCCGKKRAGFYSTPPSPTVTGIPSPPALPEPLAVWFAYTGPTALTVQGPITGRRYRFSAPGACVPVDERDAPAVSGVPHLVRVPKPASEE